MTKLKIELINQKQIPSNILLVMSNKDIDL